MAFPEKITSKEGRWRNFSEALWLRPVDAGQYALVRIAFSIVALLNWCELWPYRYSFFSVYGMIPLSVALSETEYFYFSVFGIIQSGYAVTAYFIFSAVAIICLGLGWKPRLAAFLVFLWYMSFTFRAVIATTGWDLVLRCFSFLILVSPQSESWKFPKKEMDLRRMVPVYGLTLMRLQVIVIYFQAVLARTGDPWWQNGDFFSYFLLSYHSRWSGLWVLENQGLLRLITWGTLVVELIIPILLIIPKTRWFGVGIGCTFHLLIILAAHDITMFSLTMIMTYVVFLREPDLKWIRSKLRTQSG